MTGSPAEQAGSKLESPWTRSVLQLLDTWAKRAGSAAEVHYAQATRLTRSNIRFGVPVVALTTFVGTSVFATLEHTVDLRLRITVGMLSVLAAVLASLQTFLRFGERAEKHRTAAEHWAAIRREIEELLALHPTYLASRGDPQDRLDKLRVRMDEISQQSPEMGEQGWWRSERRYRGERLPPEVGKRAAVDGTRAAREAG